MKENLRSGFSDKAKRLEEVTLYLTICFQLGHLFSIDYHCPSNICGRSEIQRYFSTTLALLAMVCALLSACAKQLMV